MFSPGHVVVEVVDVVVMMMVEVVEVVVVVVVGAVEVVEVLVVVLVVVTGLEHQHQTPPFAPLQPAQVPKKQIGKLSLAQTDGSGLGLQNVQPLVLGSQVPVAP